MRHELTVGRPTNSAGAADALRCFGRGLCIATGTLLMCVSCHGPSTENKSTFEAGCGTTTAISVAVDMTTPSGPTFTWLPDCGISWLKVYRVQRLTPSQVEWEIGSPFTNLVHSGVVYGVASSALYAPFGAAPLESGVRYLLTLEGASRDLNVGLFQRGSAEFTAP